MAVNTTPIFVNASALAYVQVSTANTARDGTGTIATLVTGDADGTLVTHVRVVGTGTTTAGVIRLFLSLDNGTTNRLIAEILVPAITPSTTVEVFMRDYFFSTPLVLPDANGLLRASTHVAETFNCFAFGGKY